MTSLKTAARETNALHTISFPCSCCTFVYKLVTFIATKIVTGYLWPIFVFFSLKLIKSGVCFMPLEQIATR